MGEVRVDVDNIEVLMVLMGKHEVDTLKIGSDGSVTMSKSRHKPATIVVPADNVSLEQHLAPLPNEPWNAIPQEEVDGWAEKGGV